MIQILQKLKLSTFDAFILCLILFVSYIIHLLIKYPDCAIGARHRKDLVGPKGIPLIGNLISLIKRKTVVQYEHELANKYGSNFSFTALGQGRVIVSNDPRTVEHVAKTNFDDYPKGEKLYKISYDVFGDGISTVNGPKWKFQRKMISHLFQGKNFRNLIYTSVIRKSKAVINILKEHADIEKPIDLKDLFSRFTIDTIGDISLGEDFRCLTHPDEMSQFVTYLDVIVFGIFGRFENPFWKFTEKYSKKGQQMYKAFKYIDDYIYNLINKHKSQLEVDRDSVKNLLASFIEAVDDNGKKFNDKELRDVVINLILGGRNTTTLALSWTIYSIMINQSVENSLLQEINMILSAEMPIPSYDDIKKFQYTTAVFYETLRLYPVVPMNGRVAIKDNVLPNNIPVFAGELVKFNAYSMGRDEKIWGEDAKKFNPKRFLESEDVLKPDQFKFPVFYAGSRACLGQHLATIEVVILVVLMLKEFKFELVPGQKSPPEFKEAMTLQMKDPLMTKVSYRTKK
ncbi:cytochrome P450 [Gigaspora rosea]|uniref:Cytochrome P450 n=1 Tax=Gigaspora rosea TaxID=44941 RepID=A0A397V975_9GLOM|nr:cytochrome P450 [Gigaspora rosea]